MFNLKHINIPLHVLCLFGICVLTYSCKKNKDPEKTIETDTVTDIQGHIYKTVKIGDQWWMAENLKVKVYNDSSEIAEVKISETDSVWANKKTGAFCEIDARYGLHYNWFVINEHKNIAPVGWHIPSDEEWKTLERTIGMSQSETNKTGWRGNDESKKLIVESSTGWPSTSAVFGTNESGFSALPGGCRLFDGRNGEVTETAYWWSSTENGSASAWYRSISTSHPTIFRYYADKNYGLTIRCVKD